MGYSKPLQISAEKKTDFKSKYRQGWTAEKEKTLGKNSLNKPQENQQSQRQ